MKNSGSNTSAVIARKTAWHKDSCREVPSMPEASSSTAKPEPTLAP